MEKRNNKYVFDSVEDIIVFVKWINDNFHSPQEYTLWFNHSMESMIPEDVFCTRKPKTPQALHKCRDCDAQFSTSGGLEVHEKVVHSRKIENDKFWEIVKEINDTQNEDHNAPDLSDTD